MAPLVFALLLFDLGVIGLISLLIAASAGNLRPKTIETLMFTQFMFVSFGVTILALGV
jgi:hypothetical protein